MDDFDAALGTREEGVANHTAATKKVEDFFTEADTILYEQVDKMMELFRTSDTPFYDAYKDARVVRDL
jgi:DNA-binding MltR family transcriptional regulator